MKAVTPGGWYEEVNATVALGEVMPEFFPKPLSYDLDRKWLLMRDYGPAFGFQAFNTDKDPELMREVLGKWAEIQKASIPLVQRLVQSGVPIFDGTRLRQEALKMADDPEWFQKQQEGMNEDERKQHTDHRAYKDEFLAFVDRVLKNLDEL